MLTLGVPSNPTMALMIGALMIQGIQPGPQAMLQRPELFWGIVASMWIGNLFLLLLNLPLVGLWVRLLAVPYRLLFPAILMFCCIGVLFDQQQPVRPLPARGVLRARLRAAQARLRAGAADPRPRAGADDGGISAARAPDLARRSDGADHEPAQRRVPGRGAGAAGVDRGAGDPRPARSRDEGVTRSRDQFQGT